MKFSKTFKIIVFLELGLFALFFLLIGFVSNISYFLSIFYPVDTEDEIYIADDDAGGLYVYGCFYYRGYDVFEQDPKKGLEWIRKSAEQDFDLAQFTMAYLYFKGDGVPQDKTEARKWAEKAEKNGFPIWEWWARWEQEEAEAKNILEDESENQIEDGTENENQE